MAQPFFSREWFIAGERFEPTTLLSKSLDNTAFFFLYILVAVVHILIFSFHQLYPYMSLHSSVYFLEFNRGL